MYTVRLCNTLLGRDQHAGTFATEAEATAVAEQKAANLRKFCTLEVWLGDWRTHGRPTAHKFTGQS